MGRVVAPHELGDVAVPPPAPRPAESLGGVTADPK
jgi:hypothetical protein